MRGDVGNMPPLPGVFPDYFAPIVRNGAEGRELVMARWGMPSPFEILKGKNRDPGVTNIRNVSSPHWRRWLGVENRCVVPFSSFAENELLPDGSRPPVWFAFDESRPLAFFAGLWTRWTSVRRVKEGQTTNDLYGFVTTKPNAEVKAIHPKAMPAILTTPDEVDAWLAAPTREALALQRPLPDGSLKIVARGDRTGDGAPS
jgi:putative SOS response-associated peptidase YedK